MNIREIVKELQINYISWTRWKTIKRLFVIGNWKIQYWFILFYNIFKKFFNKNLNLTDKKK